MERARSTVREGLAMGTGTVAHVPLEPVVRMASLPLRVHETIADRLRDDGGGCDGRAPVIATDDLSMVRSTIRQPEPVD